LANLDLSMLHLFAMAQIAGYALGGCWTHIGCAQSVVAYSFVQREVDEHYTPVQWMREMTPIVLEMLILISLLIFVESRLLAWLD
jgi:di/tricarboxylate transporter